MIFFQFSIWKKCFKIYSLLILRCESLKFERKNLSASKTLQKSYHIFHNTVEFWDFLLNCSCWIFNLTVHHDDSFSDMTSNDFFVNFMLGGVSGGISKTIVAPIERVKLLLQARFKINRWKYIAFYKMWTLKNIFGNLLN